MFTKLKYKYKRFLAWCGVWDAKHYIDKIENPELNEKEELFIKMWIDSLSNEHYSLYTINDKGLISYELHNRYNKSLLKMIKDYNHGRIEVFRLQNNVPFKNSVNIPKTVAERLINRFTTEMDNRSNVLKKYYEVKLLEVLK